MKNAAAGIAIASLVAIVAGGASAETRFRGSFTLTETKNCIARYAGETFNSTFRPANVGDNPNITSLTQLNQYSGDVYELDGASFVEGEWMSLKGWGLDNLHYNFNARLRLSRLSPATFTPATDFVLIEGKLINMGNDPGVGGKTCVASFRGAYFRRFEE